MPNHFLILELGTDLADSFTFQQVMTSRHAGLDLTPKCDYPNTRWNTLTHLSKVPRNAWKDERIKTWMEKFATARPCILYVSSHHYEYFLNEYIFNDKQFGVKFVDDGIRYGDTGVLLISSHSAMVNKTTFKEALIAVVLDGCNLISSTSASSAATFQKVLSTQSGSPVLLGFTGKSPAKGTAPLHRGFLQLLPRGEFARLFPRGKASQNNLVKYWIEAGKQWKDVRKSRLVAIDNTGKAFDSAGHSIKGTVEKYLELPVR